MQPTDVSRALAMAKSTALALGLTADDAVVLQNSNKLTVHLRPCDILARIAPSTDHVAQFEVDLAGQLAETESPAGALDPRIPPRVYEADGFAVTFWTYHAPVTSDVAPAAYGDALRRLHIGMRKIDLAAPHFTDRIAEAERLLANRDQTPELSDADRAFLSGMLDSLKLSILGHGAADQLLHGEPHPGNLLSTTLGPLFIDLETCCRGPIEFDLAHVPEAVVDHYPDVDQALLDECRALVLVMVAAWRWDAGDQFPNGRQWAEEFTRALRKGAPWPSLDAMARQLAGS
ncbi:phosphotransferase [Devosia lacusdianchii]|uniref:phosphotransferase n=1 Tax=Devosia lacusdianchii TaxID=2917991 RepID=UPI001F052338|nr:phosphotransferase [Devosia sp. JXJ CY 41]